MIFRLPDVCESSCACRLTNKENPNSSSSCETAADLDDEDKLAVLYHARDAAKIIKEHHTAPQGIEQIILETHGNPNGIGFNDNPPEEIHNLSKIFIVADSFVKKLLNPSKYKEKKEILAELYVTCQNPGYQKIIKVLEQKIE